jgi:hypothetical protein
MKTAVISPYAAKLKNGKPNAKNYPYWKELISILKAKGFYVIQIGSTDETKIDGVNELRLNNSFSELEKLVWRDETIIFSVDSFFPHFCQSVGRGSIVIWGKSDPLIFGYETNINLLKDRKYLRPDQFVYWEEVPFDKDAFMTAEEIIQALEKFDTMKIVK